MAAITGTSQDQRSNLLLVAGVLFAAAAAVLVFVVLQSRGGESATSVAATANAVVAARDIPANTRLTADMLAVQALPADARLDAAYASADELIGLPVRYPLAKGEQLTPLKVGLNTTADPDDLALVLPQGKRAVAVEVSEITGVGGLLLPGHTVDVIGVFDSNGTGTGQAVTLLQNIEVLAVAQVAQEPVAPAAGGLEDSAGGDAIRGRRPEDAERQPDAQTVTLAVSPAEAQLLSLAQENGRLWLALRPFDDANVQPLDGISLMPLLPALEERP